jgi:hypothetical protein
MYFAWRSWRYLPAAVSLASGLEEYCKPEYERHRKHWAMAARGPLHELYNLFPFDVIISPSDTFYYIRAVVRIAEKMGIPFIVVQKETTRPPHFMEVVSKQVGELFPFISDYMTVCSQRHKDFWLAAGALNDKIEVTGQPRFDFYRQPKQWRSWEQLGISVEPNTQVIIFLSYNVKVYAEWIKEGVSWARLRSETQEVLIDLARQGGYTVLVKPWPQQDPNDIAEERTLLAQRAGEAWGKQVHLLERGVDARHLIVNSDIVVGFQTTALLEALIAGKTTIYTRWSEELKLLEDRLIPYHKYAPILQCAKSPEQLHELVIQSSCNDPGKEEMEARLEIFEGHLGPLDGHSAQRVWEAVEKVMDDYPSLTEQQIGLRHSLLNERSKYCRNQIRATRLKLAFWSLLGKFISPLQQMPGCGRLCQGTRSRVRKLQVFLTECQAAASGREIPGDTLMGNFYENWHYRIRRFLYVRVWRR